MKAASLYPGQAIRVRTILSLNERLLSLALNQKSPRILLQPVLPTKCDLARFSSRKGVFPAAVSEGSTGWSHHVPASVVVSFWTAIIFDGAPESDREVESVCLIGDFVTGASVGD